MHRKNALRQHPKHMRSRDPSAQQELCFAEFLLRSGCQFLPLGAAALFVFLAGAARAGIIAPDFFSTHYLLDLLAVARSCHASLFEFLAFLALEGLFQIVHRSGDGARRPAAVAIVPFRS
jgi:hypothetical protein